MSPGPARDSPILAGHVVPWDAPDDDLRFLRQLGVRHVRLNYADEDPRLDRLAAVVRRFAGFDLRVVSGWQFAYRSLRVQLGQPGRDEDIDTWRTFLRSCGELGIGVAPYDFHPANTYTTEHVEHNGYRARQFSEAAFRRAEQRRFEREIDADEIRRHYTYFVDATLPVAEAAGVKMALHPDDPPLRMMNGVAKLFVDYEGYRWAEEVAQGNPAWGVRLCVGTWAEGGERMGRDTFGMIEDFGRRGKIFEVDFRNVSSPLPTFAETFPDDGYLDLYAVLLALRRAGFAGLLVPDHVPQLPGDEAPMRRAGLARCIGCIRAWLERVEAEAG